MDSKTRSPSIQIEGRTFPFSSMNLPIPSLNLLSSTTSQSIEDLVKISNKHIINYRVPKFNLTKESVYSDFFEKLYYKTFKEDIEKIKT